MATFGPTVRTVRCKFGNSLPQRNYRIAFPPHTFVVFNCVGVGIISYLFFHEKPNPDEIFYPYMPNTYYTGRVCLMRDNVHSSGDLEEDLLNAVNLYWNTTFNGDWSDVITKHYGLNLGIPPAKNASLHDWMDTLALMSRENPEFWKGAMVPYICFPRPEDSLPPINFSEFLERIGSHA